LPVGRERPDFGDEIIEVGVLGGLAVPFDPKNEGERRVPSRRDDQPGPGRSVKGPDEGVFPRVEDLGAEPAREKSRRARLESDLFVMAMTGIPAANATAFLL
jgi:hypothetical protein